MRVVTIALVFVISAGAVAVPPPPPQAHHHCNLVSADLPAGVAPPPFDPSRWNIAFAPRSGVTFVTTINDPTGTLAPFSSQIISNMNAAGARWAQTLQSTFNVTISIEVQLNNSFPRATGASATTVFVGSSGGFNIFEQGVAGEIRTGIEPNGAAPDVIVTLNINYTANELWFDPDPISRTIPVPTNRTDAVSVFLHELGHAVSFNGWRDNFNASLPGNFMSPFDQRTTFATDFFFSGPASLARYGAPVPLTFGNAKHVGNNPPRPGSDLIPDMMNGVVYFRGSRYDITPLDLAISEDCGVQLAPTGCDAIDFNADGLFPDTGDIDDFLSVFSGGPCSTNACGDLDFNNDGLFPDTQDIDSLLSVFSGGPCL
jgi:hypothetical protein